MVARGQQGEIHIYVSPIDIELLGIFNKQLILSNAIASVDRQDVSIDKYVVELEKSLNLIEQTLDKNIENIVVEFNEIINIVVTAFTTKCKQAQQDALNKIQQYEIKNNK